MKVMRMLSVIALVTLLAAGCAKKPAVDTGLASMEQQQVVTESFAQDTYASGIGEQAVVESVPVDTGSAYAGAGGPERIFFDFDQYTLSSQARETLAKNAAYLRANPGASFLIEGHCDERGSDEYNLALGERRALAVKAFLVDLGISSGRLQTVTYGEERPLDPRRSADAWALNRRAEFIVK